MNDRLVFRLKSKLSDKALAKIQSEFGSILVDGTFKQRDALPEESGEPDLAHMPRLVFHFNRRSLGRLRMLINAINAAE